MALKPETFEGTAEEISVVATPIAEDSKAPIKTILVQYGSIVNALKDEENTVYRYRSSVSTVTDGVETTRQFFAVDAKKAVENAINQAMVGNADDYELDADWESDALTMKPVTAASLKDDVWKGETFKGKGNEFSAGLAELESLAESIMEGQGDVQDMQRDLSAKLNDWYEGTFKRSMKQFRSFLEGAEGSSYPALVKLLGKTDSALYEAMSFAKQTEAQYSVTPNTILSGKGLDLHRAKALNAIVADAARATVVDFKDETVEALVTVTIPGRTKDAPSREVVVFTPQAGSAFIGHVKAKVFGILDDTPIDEKLAETMAEFIETVGKHVNMRDSKEAELALKVYGMVTISDAGEKLLSKATEAFETMLANDDWDADAAKLANTNTFVKSGIAAALAHAKSLKSRAEGKEALEEAEGEEIVTKKGRDTFSKFTAVQAAAHLVKLCLTHPEHTEVKRIFGQLYEQDKANRETEVAEAAE